MDFWQNSRFSSSSLWQFFHLDSRFSVVPWSRGKSSGILGYLLISEKMGFWQNCSLVFLLQFLFLHCPIVILVYHLCSFVIKQITVLVFQPSIWSNSGFLNFWLRRGSCGISEIFITLSSCIFQEKIEVFFHFLISFAIFSFLIPIRFSRFLH